MHYACSTQIAHTLRIQSIRRRQQPRATKCATSSDHDNRQEMTGFLGDARRDDAICRPGRVARRRTNSELPRNSTEAWLGRQLDAVRKAKLFGDRPERTFREANDPVLDRSAQTQSTLRQGLSDKTTGRGQRRATIAIDKQTSADFAEWLTADIRGMSVITQCVVGNRRLSRFYRQCCDDGT
jgi:hypothetical protein